MAGIEEELQGTHYRALNPVVKCQAVMLLLHWCYCRCCYRCGLDRNNITATTTPLQQRHWIV